MRHRGFCTRGIQTGPFAVGKADFVPKNFQLSDLYTGDWEPISYYPIAENDKKGFIQKWMRHRGFCTWGIQTEPFAVGKADFDPKIFQLPNLYTGEPISYCPIAENEKKVFTQKCMRHRGFCTWGIQTGPFAVGKADFVPKFFCNFLMTLCWGAHFFLPQS